MTIMVVGRRQVARKDTNYAEATGWLVEMPIGGQILEVVTDGEGIIVETLEPANMPVFVHPLILVRAMVGFEVFLGRKPEYAGSFIAPWGPPRNNKPTAIKLYLFKDGPWPTSALDAMPPKGTG